MKRWLSPRTAVEKRWLSPRAAVGLSLYTNLPEHSYERPACGRALGGARRDIGGNREREAAIQTRSGACNRWRARAPFPPRGRNRDNKRCGDSPTHPPPDLSERARPAPPPLSPTADCSARSGISRRTGWRMALGGKGRSGGSAAASRASEGLRDDVAVCLSRSGEGASLDPSWAIGKRKIIERAEEPAASPQEHPPTPRSQRRVQPRTVGGG